MKISALAVTATVLALAGPAAAQTPGPSNAPSSSSGTRVQVRTMENIFVTAVRAGVDTMAQKVRDVAPGISVVSGQPHAHGYAVENHGWFFDIEVPELFWQTIDLSYEMRRPQRQTGATNAGNTTGGGVVEADAPPLTRDDYRKAIRESLMDAILDFGQVPLKPNEWLTVGARSVDSPIPTMEDTVALVMQITGEDLSAYRQAKITREEAKKRIKVKEERR